MNNQAPIYEDASVNCWARNPATGEADCEWMRGHDGLHRSVYSGDEYQ